MSEQKLVPELRFPGFEGSLCEFKLSEVIDSMDSGWSPNCEEKTASQSEWGVLKTTSTVWEGYDETANKKLPDHLTPRKHLVIRPSDILVTRAGPVSRVGVIAHVTTTRDKLLLSDKLIRVRARLNVDSRYLAHALSSSRAQRYLSGRKSGLAEAQANITQDILKDTPVLLPSYQVQVKVADFLSSVDAKLAKLSRKKELLEDYKRGLMQQIFSQKLRFKQDDGSEFPEWESCLLGEITNIYDGTHQTPIYVDDGVPFYSVEHVTANQFETTRFISEAVFTRESKRVVLEKGDILMTRIGDIGTCKLIDWDVRASFYVSLALIKNTTTQSSIYLAHFMSSNYFKRELYKRTIHVAFPKKINLGEIGNCSTFLPCLTEQQKIADFLSSFDQKIDVVAKQIKQLEAFKKGLLQKLFV